MIVSDSSLAFPPSPWLFVIGSARLGGAEGQMVTLATRLHARGHPVACIFMFYGGDLLGVLQRAGVPYRVLADVRPVQSKAVRFVKIAAGMLQFMRILLINRPAVVMPWLTTATWTTLTLSRSLSSARRVVGVRGEVQFSKAGLSRKLYRKALAKAHAVVVNSPSLVDHALLWGARIDAVHSIPNGVTMSATRGDHAVARAVVISNFRPYKGHDLLLESLDKCSVEVQVRLAGEGESRSLVREAARDYGLDGSVSFVDVPADVPHELSQSGFAIHPSRTEGLSNAILEELSAGLAVVAWDVGGNSSLIKDGINGFLVDLGDIGGFADAIDRLASSQALRASMGEAARRSAEAFNWASCVSRYENLFYDILCLEPSPHPEQGQRS